MTLDNLITTLQAIKDGNPGADAEIEDELFVMFEPGHRPAVDVEGTECMAGGYLINAD